MKNWQDMTARERRVSDRNGYIRVALVAPAFCLSVYLNNPAPIFLGLGLMAIFQLANGEGFY
jgi:hypothetical protein